MAKVNEIKIKLSIIDDQLKRIDEYVNNFDRSTSVSKLISRRQILEDLRKDFQETQYKYEILDSRDEMKDLHREARSTFENMYCDIMAEIMDVINAVEQASSPQANTPAPETRDKSDKLQLPVINLGTFSGNYKHWINFENSFKSIIDENKGLDKRQKLQYLKSCLRDEALRAVESLTIEEVNYDKTWEILENRFKNTRLIVQDHVMSIVNAAPINKQSYSLLRELLDNLITNIAALKAFSIRVESWDALLIPIVTEKLDYNTKKEWQASLDSNVPTYEQFIKFLEKRCMVLESINLITNKPLSQTSGNTSFQKPAQSNKRTVTLASTNQKSNIICVYCKKSNHAIYQCTEFVNLTVQSRNEKSRLMKLCLNCLRNNHTTAACRNKSRCRDCGQAHHSLLHLNSNSQNTNQTEVKDENAIIMLNNHSYFREQESTVLLATAIVLIKNARHQYIPCRLFLDPGSMSNCISREMASRLGLKLTEENFEIKGLNGTISTAKQSVNVDIKSNHNEFIMKALKCIVVDTITEKLPLTSINLKSLEIPKNIQLADPEFYNSRPVDLLLGSGSFWSLLSIGQITLPSGLTLQKTQLGFIVAGSLNNNYQKITSKQVANNVCATCISAATTTSTDDALEERVSKFWELESVSVSSEDTTNKLTAEELQCEEHFKNNTLRDVDGRFIVKLPIKNNTLELGDTKNLAMKRFFNLEKRLSRSPELKTQYTNFIHEYIELNHMQLVDQASVTDAVYLPHHSVIKNSSSTTRLRVVFDASAKSTNGFSLNDNLMCGPIIQRDLFSIVLEFRTFKYALNADIAKMYRQILIHPDDRKYQHILWREQSNESLRTYQLLTLTYGTKPASFIATRCLLELANINTNQYPKACDAIKKGFYMDDLLVGADTILELNELKNDIVAILKQGGFQLRKFQANDDAILPLNEANDPHLTVQLNKNEFTKILGLFWNPGQDLLTYDINLTEIPKKVTKRTILSTTSQIFDPLGLLGPVIMKSKIILQHLWAAKLSWDEAVPMSIHTVWTRMIHEFNKLTFIKIPRKIASHLMNEIIEIHAFCDASLEGYGAAIYFRTLTNTNQYDTHLVCAKSRVAPIKTISLPRLELCGALLLARLVTKVKKCISIEITHEYYWTDSSIVLAWIDTSPNALKTFVSNRVSEITQLTSSKNWRHVRSEDNAADILSRGAYPSELVKNTVWFNGPSFLSKDESEWANPIFSIDQVKILETRPQATICNVNIKIDLLEKYSKLKKLQRVTAWVLRFISNCRSRNRALHPYLSSEEIYNATLTVVRLLQQTEFSNEYSAMSSDKPLSRNSTILSLSPFFDKKYNIIRVGGRLRNANIADDVKYPILLPKGHYVTRLIIKHEHEQQLHAGPEATLAALRQRFWIMSARSVIRSVLHHCHKCFRVRPIATKAKMGDLPSDRVQPARPFTSTGVDFAGPVYVRETRGRGKKVNKAYIALFICFATKAVHIELVADLTTQEFLAALKRFISRRGHPFNIYSDNGTNFVGANNELKELYQFFRDQDTQNKIHNESSNIGIKWHFLPAKAPSMGGLWESNIKSMKTHLKRVLGNTHLTYSEMNTLLVRIEACMNSRPLLPLSSNPNDLEVLTPFHFLIGESMTTFREHGYEEVSVNRLSRWQLIEQIRTHFWKRWSREYLTSLQNRAKWYKEASKESPADINGKLVLLMEDNVQPLLWKLGRIIDCHPGNDDHVRVVTVQTPQGLVKRSLRKVCPLPVEKAA